MKNKGVSLFIYLLIISSWNTALIAQINKIVLDMNEEGAPVPSSLFGIFFGEINHAGDSGFVLASKLEILALTSATWRSLKTI